MTSAALYLDNAATSFPKPASVTDAVCEYMTQVGASSGRAYYQGAVEAGNTLFEVREKLASLCGVSNPMRAVFSASATDALNTAILGCIEPGDHVITTSFEHNSTIRPLMALKQRGDIELSIVEADEQFELSEASLRACVQSNTKALVFNWASNVFGTCAPLSMLARFAKHQGLISICDASQAMGVVPLDMATLGLDLVAFPAHKGLLGPMGLGVLMINDSFDIKRLKPLTFGGTGSRSDDICQPDFLPDKYESGTHNMPAIAGLNAALDALSEYGIERVYAHKRALTEAFYLGAKSIARLQTYVDWEQIQTGTISFNLAGVSCSELGLVLAERYRIQTRVGLHCSPLAHRSMGTFPEGAVRISFGIYTTPACVERLIAALKEVADE
ncbi:aminotransferase class V-fold PLP-dependent enzyme [Paraferrimonas sedimenticola]|uniref:Cysteine desulfurase n=1 Tax=Paraferrimonas sedimenticola TaxID=375674 RepID=A0AA37RXH8_9GAMM|nr:aminotransferase class V-fold PLP-dependent enzyme [Paraferrimonas sedimenticola]GLP97326.1 cysteine desulfurase [Paraferrimonas sedimenticola]